MKCNDNVTIMITHGRYTD